MPKLNGIHIFERLRERLEQLEAGEEIAAKEIRSLLTPEQQQELEDAWKEQQELRKGKRARTAEEEKELGWKAKMHWKELAELMVDADIEAKKI